MARTLVIGAGGIGRGFMPWLLQQFTVDFYDLNAPLVSAIRNRGGYTSFMSDGQELSSLSVAPGIITDSFADLDLDAYAVAFIAVGPRNVSQLPDEVRGLNCPIYSLENDPSTVEVLREQYGLSNVYFAVPDVITSSTASPENLATDPQALHTEDGVLFLQETPAATSELRGLLPDVKWLPVEQLNAEWDAKLYIHNTPHCISAYLGFLAGRTYVHEALAVPSVARILDGVVEEILYALKIGTPHDHQFLEWYAGKEIRRFANPLLFDPIHRVAREPIRKLQPSGRLTGALRLMLWAGVQPTNLMLGIAAALRYTAEGDNDRQAMRLLHDFGVPAFLKFHLGIDPGSMESDYIASHFDQASAFLDRTLS